MKEIQSNPLGSLAIGYSEPKKHIYVNQDAQTLEFYVARIDSPIANQIFELAASMYMEKQLYPLENTGVICYLYRVYSMNSFTYSKVAVKVKIDDIDLHIGFVPKAIDLPLVNNLNMVGQGQIKKIQIDYGSNSPRIKVIFPYGESISPTESNSRFSDMVSEL